MIVKTESQAAYSELFDTTRHFARVLFGIKLDVAVGCLDHSSPIMNGFKEAWPDIRLITCWPHTERNCRNHQKDKLRDAQYFEAVILPHIQWLHKSRSLDQFTALIDQCTQTWIEDGEEEYASWFTSTYADEDWGTWYYGSGAGICGVLPSQNPIESFHKAIKTSGIPTKRAPTSVYFNKTTERLLVKYARDLLKDEPHTAVKKG